MSYVRHTDLDHRHLHGVARKRERLRQTRAARVALGLTTRGTSRQRELWPQLAGLDRRTRHRVQVNTYYRRNIEAGLTARGTKRIYGRLPEREEAWREFRATISINQQP